MKKALLLITLLFSSISGLYAQYAVDVKTTDVSCNNGADGTATVAVTGDFGNNCAKPVVPTVSCSSGCSQTISDNSNITVDAGGQYCLTTQNYSGTIKFNGGTLVVCGSIAETANINANGSSQSTMVVLGSATLKDIPNPVHLVNYGTINFTGSITLAGKVTNHGTIIIPGQLQINDGSVFYNTGVLQVAGDFHNSAEVVNGGTWSVGGELRNNGGAKLTNTCTLKATTLLNSGGARLDNYGNIQISSSMVLQANSKLYTYPLSQISTPILSGTGEIIGEGDYCSSVVAGTLQQQPTVSGNVKVCQQGNSSCLCDLNQAPCTYKWSSGHTTATVENLAPGTYTLTITCLGKTVTETVVIKEPAALEATVVTKTDATCANGQNGSVDLQIKGGTGPYTYNWSNGSTLEDPANLPVGTHTVVVTDAKGCKSEQTVTISAPAPLQATATQNGSTATVSASGGTGPYTYQWSNGATGAVQDNLTKGTYTVTVIDAKGCTFDMEVVVGAPDEGACAHFKLSFSTKGPGCKGGANGWVNLQLTGGTAPYTYQWSNGASTEDIYNLTVGTYSVKVTDAAGCSLEESLTLTEADALAAPAVGTNITCFGQKDGVVVLQLSGGTAPYSFSWSNGAVTKDLAGLAAGEYTVKVTDASNCMVEASVIIAQPEQLQISVADFGRPNCYGASNGYINVQHSGGTAPFTYAWSHGASTKDVSNLAAGDYSLVVTDARGCTISLSHSLSEPPVFALSLSAQDVSCASASNGAVIATVTGGVAPFTYQWSNNANTKNLFGVAAGDYTLTVTDAKGCTAIGTASVKEVESLQLNAQSTPVSCYGAI